MQSRPHELPTVHSNRASLARGSLTAYGLGYHSGKDAALLATVE